MANTAPQTSGTNPPTEDVEAREGEPTSLGLDDSGRRGEKSRVILEAAVEVFAEKGFQKARVSDIARAAGVADGTIYLYFRNKEDLLLTVFEDAMSRLSSELRRRLEGVEGAGARIRTIVEFHFAQVRAFPSTAEVLTVELRTSEKFVRFYRPEPLLSYLRIFGDVVREGQARGELRADVQPYTLMWTFFGALDEIAVNWLRARKRDPERFDLDAAGQQLADLFIRGLSAPVPPPPTLPTEESS